MQMVTVKQIQALDKEAIEEIGIESLVLMENAGRSVAIEVIRMLHKKRSGHVCVVCGLGNNAGDGFVTARYLINAGVKTDIILIGQASNLKEDTLSNYMILKKIKYPILEIDQVTDAVCQRIGGAKIIVDALFGVGLNRNIKNPFLSIIKLINSSAGKTISVDIPSGLDGTTGKIYGVCVKAEQTITFSVLKQGFKRCDGSKMSGKVKVIDIGIPKVLIDQVIRHT